MNIYTNWILLRWFQPYFICWVKLHLHERPSHQRISSQRPSRSFQCTNKSHIRIDAATSRKSWSSSIFVTKSWVVIQSQRGSRSFEHAVVESLSIVVIYYCFLLFSFQATVFPYFPIEWMDASCQSLATYLVTDSLRFGRSCKRAFRHGYVIIWRNRICNNIIMYMHWLFYNIFESFDEILKKFLGNFEEILSGIYSNFRSKMKEIFKLSRSLNENSNEFCVEF